MPSLPPSPPPVIPDHELLKCVGRGGYGEVWLARNIMGTFRAVKIVHRASFDSDRPFEREFAGIQKFEPVSRTHTGLVAVLHIGRSEGAGPDGRCFYYMMEVADDVESGTRIDPVTYKPRTLGAELQRRGRLPLVECVTLGVALTAALDHLHRQGLVHRDIKPSNFIFVNGNLKFADVGLVTDIGERATFVGTAGFIPPEGPGSPTADIFSLGKVLYQMVAGKPADAFPEVPSLTGDETSTLEFLRLNPIILKACEANPRRRYQSASEMNAALALAGRDPPKAPGVTRSGPAPSVTTTLDLNGTGMGLRPGFRVALLYKSKADPDERLVQLLQTELASCGCNVFMDSHLTVGVEWAREIAQQIREADAVVIFLSEASVQSEMIAYEVEVAAQARERFSRPMLLPVRVQFGGVLPPALAHVLDPLHYFLWRNDEDNERLVGEILRSFETSQRTPVSTARQPLECAGGAVPLTSEFYIVRSTDLEFQEAIKRRDSIVLVKGARQMGKTSLLARGLQQARQSEARVVLTDFQKLNADHLANVEGFFQCLADFLADQLDLPVQPREFWEKHRGANTNFERYLRREVLGKVTGHLVWGLDEVDRLFACEFGGEVFGLFRSWHNERALDPTGPWSRLTLAIAYATEAHLFITDLNQSPFNVGTRLTLEDFTFDQVADLNQRHGSPLRDTAELRRFHDLLGGQPYLVRRGLNELASGTITLPLFVTQADRDEGVFGDHLRRMLVLLAQDAKLADAVRGALRGQSSLDPGSFYRLRSAGVLRGDSPATAQFRCEIYASYLKGHLA